MKFLLPLLAVPVVLVATPVAAQERPTPAPNIAIEPSDTNDDTLTIGAGAVYLPSYQGSNDYVVTPIVAARGQYHGISFFTRGAQLFVDLVPTPPGPRWAFSAGPVLSADLNRTGRVVDTRIKALGKRKIALEAGGYIGIGKTGVITSDYDSLSLRVSYVHDVGTVHRSYIVTPALDYSTPLSKSVLVGLTVSADYAGAGYARTYYDVDAPGALRSGLPVFAARKGWQDVTVGAIAGFSLSGDLRHGAVLVVGGGYSRMQEDFAASPVTRIAGSPNQFYGALGLGYTF
ncbi:MipA/OmpV family protein [Sphingomonas sp. AR_OL41]|uniref:MipA/OmpV family protein n=1 Tax=Sphingomonas sp. AR_OL41 TaxID=3042729 RepID=UPI0024808E60|nr:MipA/OmpV family protein [Sphingomonas sp. AR_OL41]MDH7974085.1 MipA/OmpV family protein [Sphingomonas sp. AR_OL41]